MKKNLRSNSLYYKSSISEASRIKITQKEFFVSYVYLALRLCFFLLAFISLIKLGYSSKVRLTRLQEIKESYLYEKLRFKALSSRFDNLFSFGGEQRFMKDQDQMISKDVIRVIWR